MRVFFDTNVIFAALMSDGPCKTLFRQVTDGTITGVVSEQVIDELSRNLKKLLRLSPERRAAVVETLRLSFEVVPTPGNSPRLSRDPTDDSIIAAGSENADLIVTGDKDILPLSSRKMGIEAVTPADLLRRLSAP